MQLTEKELDRFWNKVQKSDGCWIWNGAVMITGYGMASLRGKHYTAHHIAYIIQHGKHPPKGFVIMHTCDNRLCISPHHLKLGTQSQNTIDMYRKGRRNISPGPTEQQVKRVCEYCGVVFMRTISIHKPESELICSQTCRAARRRDGNAEDFWKNVDRVDASDCWEWKGAKFKNGYGQSNLNIGRVRLAHRVAWILMHGEIPPHMFILHSCDNRACVNPAHLSLGTHIDNMADMTEKKRHGRYLSPERYTHGTNHPMSMFTAKQIRDIRKRREEGATYSQLMREFSAGKSTIARIVRGQNYTDVS